MAQYIRLPSGRFLELGPEESAQQALMRGMKQHPEEFNFGPEKQPEGGFGAAFSAGVSRLLGETALTAGKAGILDLAQAEEIYRRQQKKAEQIFKPTEEGWTESPWQKFKEVAGGSAAYMLAPAAAGAAALAAPATLPAGVIGAGLAGLTSLGQFTGSNLAAQMEENKQGLAETSGAAAVGAAIPQAALDVLAFRLIPGVQRLFGSAGREITEAQAKALAAQTLRQKIGDYTAATGRTMGYEGATEVAQDVLEKLQAGAEIADPKARDDYIESLIGGAALAAALGPLGRGFERAGISARGRELEKKRLGEEARAAEEEARAFKLTPSEESIGPEAPAELQTKKLQDRLSEIENEVTAARQAKDTDALLGLMRERNTLESQLEELTPAKPSPFERRREMEQQRSALENMQAQLLAQVKAAETAQDKRVILERLVPVQQQLKALEKEFEQAEKTGEISTLVTQQQLLDAEKRALRALKAAEEKGDAEGQLKAAARLEALQGQLGLFGMEAFAADEQAAARSRAQEALQASGRTLRLPAPAAQAIPMGLNTDLFSTPPYSPQTRVSPRQETLFGLPERQYEVSTEQAGMPQRQLEQAVDTLATKPDLTPEDRSLLERVQAVATPAPGVPLAKAVANRVLELDVQRDSVNRAIKTEKAKLSRVTAQQQQAQQNAAALKTRVAELTEKVRIMQKDAKPEEVAQLAALRVTLSTAAAREKQALERVQALNRRLAQDEGKRKRRLDSLERRLSAIQKEESSLPEVSGTLLTPEQLSSLQELRSRLEADLLARGNRALKADEAAAAEEGVTPEEIDTLSDSAKLKILRQLAAPRPAAGKRPGDVSADLPAQRGKYALQGDPKLTEIVKRLDRLDKIEAEFNARLAAADRKPLTLLERLSTTGAVRARERVAQIQKEIDALERGTQADQTMSGRQKLERIAELREEQARLRQDTVSLRQRITDWLNDTARGVDNTASKQALEEALQQVEAAQRGEKEALTTTRRRMALPEEQQLLSGKKTVVEKVSTDDIVEAQQPDLFAGTEAASAVEFQTPEQFQKFMGSEELNKLRRQQGLLKPTVAYLQKQAEKIQAKLDVLAANVKLFAKMQMLRTEGAEKALANAQKQYAEAWQEVLNALPAQHAQYLRAKEGLANARETYAGLADFQKAAMDALDRDLSTESAWAQADRAEKERFLAALKEPKQNLEAAIEKLAAMREQIAKAQIGEAVDPYTALWPEYSLAQKEAQKAYEAFQKVIRDRTKVVPPANAVVASKEIQNFLVQDVELTEMLINQQREVYKFERVLAAAEVDLEAAKAQLRQDPLLVDYLDAAEDAVAAAQQAVTAETAVKIPEKLQTAIQEAANKLKQVQQQTAPSPGATAGERYARYTDPDRAEEIKKELALLQTERDKLTRALRNVDVIKTETGFALVPKRRYRGAAPEQFQGILTAQELLRLSELSSTDARVKAITPKTRVALLEGRIEELQKELNSIDRYKLERREQSVAAAEKRSAQQARTSQEIQTKNERLAREAEATARVTFAPLSPEKQRALDEAQQQLDTVIKNKQAAIEKKEKQTQNFRLAPKLKKTVADAKKAQADALEKLKKDIAKAVKDGKKTKAVADAELEKAQENALAAVKKVKDEAVEEQRAADIQKISAMFDKQIAQKQAVVQALRGVSLERPSERRETQARQFRELQQRIGEPVTMTEAMQAEVLTDAEKKAIDDGIKTLEQVMADRGRVGRTGQTVVNVRTGRVSEAPRAISSRDLTNAAQEVETAEANRLSAQFAADADERYLKGLLAYAKEILDLDLSGIADDVVAVEYAILNAQAEAEETQKLKRKPTTKEQEKAAKAVADSLDRVISSEYTDRENTPLDETTAAAVNKGNLVQALTSLAENGSTPFVRMVAKRLLPMVENTKLETEALEGKGGEFDPNTNTVTLNKDALTEEDLLHEAGHAATNTVASYEPKEFGMTRRQFLKGAVSGLTAMKLPSIGENLSLDAQERLFFEMLDGWGDWASAANKLVPSLKLDAYMSLDVADRDLRGFLTQLEYNEVDDRVVTEMLENGGLKKLQSAINASQRAIMAEAAKTGEGKAEAQKETFTPTKEQLDARTALEKLYAKMQSRPEFKDEYANVSFKEFVSELLSNQQVRDKVNQTAGLLRRIYEGFLRMLGIEPTTLSDKAVEQAFAMFSPSQASVNREERLASIMRGVFPGTGTKFSAAVPQSVQDAVNKTIGRTATLGDKIVANTLGLRLRTFIADNWAPTESIVKMGVETGKLKEAQALQMRVYMRLYNNQQQYTNAALSNGVPEIVEEKGTGVSLIEGGDAQANARTIAAALGKASALGNQQAVERLFTYWMASLRAKQDGVGFEKFNFGLTPADLKNIQTSLVDLEQVTFKNNPEVKAAFEEARALYKEHNKRLLKLQVQTGAMSQEVADELGKGDYIGYYRVDNNGVVELVMGGSRPMRIGSVVDQPYLKELVGGEQHILPFFSSMVQNTSMLMTIALKNLQNKGTARMFENLGLGKVHIVKDGQQSPLSKIRFKSKGNEFWFEADKDAFDKTGVPVDLMMQGLQGVKTAVPALVRGLAMPADILRKAIRRLPTYTLKQTIRDPMHAWMVTGGNFTPVLSTWKELYKGMTGTSQTQMTLEQAAVVAKGVYQGDTESVANMLRELSGNPSKFSQTMMKLDEFAMRGEAATRAVLYDTFRKKGMGHIESLLNTVETMNNSRRGTSASLHWLSMLTPFFNAQIQGLDSVYRSLKRDNTFEEKMNARNKLLQRAAWLAGGTMLYAAMMEDDETYKNATPAERYGNWFVPVPGTDATIRVPIPFELGLIFKSLPEAFINTAYGDTKSKEAAKALGKQLYMSSPFGIPTAIKGPLEVAFNYDMYSDQPIETARERAMDPDQRYRNGTTELAKLLGKTGVISPVQIDHLVRSYLSSAGIAMISTANFALRPLTSREGVEKPEMALEEMPVVGSIFQPRTGRGMVNAAFDDMHRIERAANTYKTLAASDPKAAQAYADEFAKEISMASFAGRFRQQMGEFAKYKRMIAANPDLTPAEKRTQIEAIKEQEIQYSTMLRKLAA